MRAALPSIVAVHRPHGFCRSTDALRIARRRARSANSPCALRVTVMLECFTTFSFDGNCRNWPPRCSKSRGWLREMGRRSFALRRGIGGFCVLGGGTFSDFCVKRRALGRWEGVEPGLGRFVRGKWLLGAFYSSQACDG